MNLVVSGITKKYPAGIEALTGVDMTIRPGEVFGLVGPNGAGKTTLLKVISGLLRVESGTVTYGSEDITGDPARAARYIGLMPDPLGVYTDITTRDYLDFFGRVLGLERDERDARINEVVDELELSTWLDAEVETLSAGWQRRVSLGRILLARTPVLLLDEPAAGLDVSARKELLGIVRRLASQNRSIVISSHILPELQDLCDRFGILDAGKWKKVAGNQTDFLCTDLEEGMGQSFVEITCSDSSDAQGFLGPEYHAKELSPGVIRITIRDGRESVAKAIRELVSHGVDIYEVARTHRGLSDIVLSVLNGSEHGEES